MMSRIISCTHHKHRTYEAVLRCWRKDWVRIQITGTSEWGVVCQNQSGDYVVMFWNKEEAERFLQARLDNVMDPRHNRGFLIQVHL